VIYSLGDRKVAFHGDDWFIADNATVIGSVVLQAERQPLVQRRGSARRQRRDHHWRKFQRPGRLAILHTDPGILLTIGRDVTVGHLAMLHGCIIGDNSLIGIKSLIMNRAVIGKNCLIGANSLIPEGKVIPDGSLVMGSPGKIVRTLTEQEIENLRLSAGRYVENFKRFQRDLRQQD
jgi:carbonic anhydrase/acetyltransferase-like protein (isoleucine patch superfamily)